jgi:hypothetical protein
VHLVVLALALVFLWAPTLIHRLRVRLRPALQPAH